MVQGGVTAAWSCSASCFFPRGTPPPADRRRVAADAGRGRIVYLCSRYKEEEVYKEV